MRLEQLFTRVRALSPGCWSEPRLTDVLSRDTAGPHRFNERLIAEYYDDLADRAFGALAAVELRFTLMAIALCLRSARAPVLAMSSSGERVLKNILVRAGAGEQQVNSAVLLLGEARKGNHELPLHAASNGAPASDTWIIDLNDASVSDTVALTPGIERLLQGTHCIALAFSNASAPSALEPAAGRFRARGAHDRVVTHRVLKAPFLQNKAQKALRIEMLNV